MIWDAYFVYDGNEYHHKDFKNLGYFGISYSYENSKLIEKAYKMLRVIILLVRKTGMPSYNRSIIIVGFLKGRNIMMQKGS